MSDSATPAVSGRTGILTFDQANWRVRHPCVLREDADECAHNYHYLGAAGLLTRTPCVQTDPHTGYNEAAANATRKAVKEFVRTVFKLEP